MAAAGERIGMILLHRNDIAGALGEYESFLAISEKLATSDPSDANRQRNLAIAYYDVGTVLVTRRALDDALSRFRAALAIF